MLQMCMQVWGTTSICADMWGLWWISYNTFDGWRDYCLKRWHSAALSVYVYVFSNSYNNAPTIHWLTSKYLRLPFYPTIKLISLIYPPNLIRHPFFSSHSIHNVSLITFIALTMIIRQHLTEKKKKPHLSPLAVDSYFSAAYLKTINERHLLKYWISHIFQVDWLSGCSFA